MKTIGLIGGMSWQSSLEYYRIINETAKKRLGGFHSAKSIMYSFDFHDVEYLQHQGRWDDLSNQMINISKHLKHSGADFIIICSNTMHIMADVIEKEAHIKVLHIVDVIGDEINKFGFKKVGLIGTRFLMSSDFYKNRLKNNYDIDVIIPDDIDSEIIQEIIFDELVKGIIKESSKMKLNQIINKLETQGSEGVILGCTEIPLLVNQDDFNIPVFNTTRIHAEKAVDFASYK